MSIRSTVISQIQQVAAEQKKAKDTAHSVVGGVEFAFAKDRGGVLKDSAIPA